MLIHNCSSFTKHSLSLECQVALEFMNVRHGVENNLCYFACVWIVVIYKLWSYIPIRGSLKGKQARKSLEDTKVARYARFEKVLAG